MRRILVADPSTDLVHWVETLVQALSASATVVHTSEQLEETLLDQGPFDLIFTHNQLQKRSGLQVLARARSLKETIPFIIVLSLHGPLLRVMVSDTTAQTLSSRMLDRQNLAALAVALVRDSSRPASCRRAVAP